MRALLVALTVALAGCKHIEYVSVPTMVHDTLRVSELRTDSIRIQDSIILDRAGDTVIREVYRYRDRYTVRHDSIYLSRTDTVTIVQVREVEKNLKAKERMYLSLGKGLWWFLVVFVLYIVYRLTRK